MGKPGIASHRRSCFNRLGTNGLSGKQDTFFCLIKRKYPNKTLADHHLFTARQMEAAA
jgi:hypothetical protein